MGKDKILSQIIQLSLQGLQTGSFWSLVTYDVRRGCEIMWSWAWLTEDDRQGRQGRPPQINLESQDHWPLPSSSCHQPRHFWPWLQYTRWWQCYATFDHISCKLVNLSNKRVELTRDDCSKGDRQTRKSGIENCASGNPWEMATIFEKDMRSDR